MNKRNITLLLIILRDNLTENIEDKGLCWAISGLYIKHTITKEEGDMLKKHISDNRPIFFNFDSFFQFITGSGYYFEPGNIKSRIKWLDYHINKL
jgi:hypothetical protein